MLKKLFAAAICGIVIASIAGHADATATAGNTRKNDTEREQTMTALDTYFDGFQQTSRTR